MGQNEGRERNELIKQSLSLIENMIDRIADYFRYEGCGRVHNVKFEPTRSLLNLKKINPIYDTSGQAPILFSMRLKDCLMSSFRSLPSFCPIPGGRD